MGDNGYLNYRELYNKEFGRSSPGLENPITIDQAFSLFQDYITTLDLPDLRIGNFIDNGNAFEADIIRRDGSIEDIITLDKQTGEIRSRH